MNPKVLIVDDEDYSLEILRELLGDQFAFDYVSNGQEALTAVTTGNPAIILLDVEMPGGMDGYQVCRAIKDNQATQNIPVIFISAHTDTQNRLQAYESGGDDYVSKPFNADELKHKFDLALANQEKRNELAEKARKAATVAMMSLREAADSGMVLGFLSDIIRQNDLEEMAATTLSALRKFRIEGAVQLRDGQIFLSRNSAGACTPVEDAVLTEMAGKERIVDLGRRSAFNYQRASIIVYDMPVSEPELYGRLKDIVVKMAEALDVHLRSLEEINHAIAQGNALREQFNQHAAIARELGVQLRTQRDETRHGITQWAERLEKTAGNLPDVQKSLLLQLAKEARSQAMAQSERNAEMDKQLATLGTAIENPSPKVVRPAANAAGAASAGGERFNSVELF